MVVFCQCIYSLFEFQYTFYQQTARPNRLAASWPLRVQKHLYLYIILITWMVLTHQLRPSFKQLQSTCCSRKTEGIVSFVWLLSSNSKKLSETYITVPLGSCPIACAFNTTSQKLKLNTVHTVILHLLYIILFVLLYKHYMVAKILSSNDITLPCWHMYKKKTHLCIVNANFLFFFILFFVLFVHHVS